MPCVHPVDRSLAQLSQDSVSLLVFQPFEEIGVDERRCQGDRTDVLLHIRQSGVS
jgi:hypothetical protein